MSCIYLLLGSSRPHLCCANSTLTSIFVRWRAPLHPNGIIRYYRLRYAVGHLLSSSYTNITYVNINGAAESYNITGLWPATTYTLTIATFTVKLGKYSLYLAHSTLPESKWLLDMLCKNLG